MKSFQGDYRMISSVSRFFGFVFLFLVFGFILMLCGLLACLIHAAICETILCLIGFVWLI